MSVQSRLSRPFIRSGENGDGVARNRDWLSLTGDEAATARVSVRAALQPATDAAAALLSPVARLDDPVFVPTALTAAQIAIIGYNTDDGGTPQDMLTFVLLEAIGSGTVIYFTDRSWNGTAFGAAGGGEGTYTYTAGADLAAGTIVTITSAQLSAAGMNLSDAGETIYAFQGTNANTPTVFLYAADIADGNTTFNGSLVNTGLVAGTSAVAVAGDNAHFGDRGHNLQRVDLLGSIGSATNWSPDNNTSQLSPNGNFFNAPDQVIFAALSGDAGLFRAHRDGSDVSTMQHAYYQWIDNPATHFNHPNEIVFDTVHGLFFVADTDTGNRRILQGNIADLFNPGQVPTLTVLWQDLSAGTGGGQVNGLAIDSNHNGTQGALYFVNQTNFNRIVYDHDGTSPTNQAAVTLANFGAGQFANEIALDIASGRAWVLSTASSTEPYTVPAGTPGAIFDPDSGTWYLIGTNVTNNQIYTITGLDRSDNGVGQNVVSALTFSGVNDDPSIAGNTDFNDAYGQIMSIDIDEVNGYLYFVTQQLNLGTAGEVGGIYRYNLSTGVVQQLYSEGNATDYGFRYIAVDAATGRYYVTNISFEGAAGEPNGTAVNTSTIMVGQLGVVAAPTVFANTPDMNSAAPWGLTIQNAPTVTANALAATTTEQNNLPNSGLTSGALLFSAVVAGDLDTVNGTDELAGAQVRISGNFQSGAGHQDSLRIQGNESGTIASSGIAYSYNATTGVLILSGPGTVSEYQQALALVTFHSSGDNVTNYGMATTRTIAASVFDGLLYSDEISNTVTVVGINDAPVNNGMTGSFSGASFVEDGAAVALTGISVLDADADPASQNISVTLSVSSGVLTLLTNVGGGIVAGNITAGANNSASITITATQNQINATLAAANGLTYTPSANFNGNDALTVVTNDQGATGNDPGLTGTGTSEQDSDSKTIVITPVNDAPDLTPDSPATVGYIENASGTALLSGGAVTDTADQTYNPGQTFAGGSYTVAITAGLVAGDQIVLLSGSGFTIVGSELRQGATAIGTIAGNGTSSVSVTALTAAATNAVVDALTRAFSFQSSSDNPGSGARTVTFTFNDGGNTGGGGGLSNATIQQVNVTAVNDAPTSGNLSGDAATYTEQQAQAALLDVGSNGGISDVDSANFDTGTLTVAITGGLVAAEDQLVIRVTGTVSFNGTAVFVNGTQIATYTGAGAGGGPLVFALDGDATPAAVSELVRAIAYTNSAGDNPTDGNRTITWTLVDGDGTLNSGQDTSSWTTTVNVDPVDDTGTAGADSATVAENGTVVLTVLANDNDPDGPPLAAAQINGNAVAVGGSVLLASGARVTRNADGTLTYDTNGAFGATPAAGSGASNTPASDSFTYTLAGGGTATVTMTITGIDTNDTLNGTAGSDFLRGGVGTDTLNGLGGNDFLDGEAGADVMVGGQGDDFYYVDDAGDAITEVAGEGTNDRVFAAVSYTLAAGVSIEKFSTDEHIGTNAINLTGNAFAQAIFGNAGSNVLDGGGGGDELVGLGGDDSFYVSSGDIVTEYAGGGNDRVYARTDYALWATREVETLSTDNDAGVTARALIGNELNQTIIGNAGFNLLDGGGGGGDTLRGLGGGDWYYVRTGDVIEEATNGGSDRLFAFGSYVLNAGASVELMSTTNHSGTGAINLTGNELAQTIYGNAGMNFLDGGLGADELLGLGGADTFVFRTALGNGNIDRILDFVTVVDEIALDDAIFTGLSTGALPATAFVIGTAAADADDRIIYDQTTGALYFDADGNGAGAQVQFATLNAGQVLAASDFIVI